MIPQDIRDQIERDGFLRVWPTAAPSARCESERREDLRRYESSLAWESRWMANAAKQRAKSQAKRGEFEVHRRMAKLHRKAAAGRFAWVQRHPMYRPSRIDLDRIIRIESDTAHWRRLGAPVDDLFRPIDDTFRTAPQVNGCNA